jgi:putative tryptophan/tyrosine transport system substrate-binding protein
MKLSLKIAALTLLTAFIAACHRSESQPTTTVGIVVPLEHKAMDEIVAGFSETLKKMYNKPIVIKVENAQNDPNLERAIISQMRDQGMSLIVPIGTDASQMTAAMVHGIPIDSLAAEMSDTERHQLKSCEVALVHDEISAETLITFIHQVYPKITKLTLVHSPSNNL